MSWVLFVLFLSLGINGFLSEGSHLPGKKRSSAVVVGTVYRDTCFQDDFSKSSRFISGASVAVECIDEKSDPTFRQEVKTDNHGEFRVKLPFLVSKHVKKIKRCSVKLLSSSEPYYAVASSATSSSIRLKSRKPGTRIFSAGFFTFKPKNQPEICSHKPIGLQDSKTGLTDPFFPPPVQDPVMPDPSPLPGLPKLPPLPSLPIPPLPGIPGTPPMPRNSPQAENSQAFLPNKKPITSLPEKKPEVKPDFFLPPIPLLPPPLLPPNPLVPPPSLLPPIPFVPPPSLLPPNPLVPPPSFLPPNPFQPPPAPVIPPLPPIPGLITPPPPPPRTLPVPLPPLFPGIPPASPSKKLLP